MIRVVLDACVPYSALLRGFLLSFASGELIKPFWSQEIQGEWTRSLLQNRPDLKRENLERICKNMDVHFPTGLVRGYESITPTLTLPDPKDRHVLAVAIHVEAEYIVTFDLNDFPETTLRLYGVEALSPDEFVLQLIQISQKRVLETIKDHRLSLTRPSQTVDEYLVTLEKQGLPKTVAFLRERKDDI